MFRETHSRLLGMLLLFLFSSLFANAQNPDDPEADSLSSESLPSWNAPDLSVLDVEAPERVPSGEEFSFRFVIGNLGTARSGPSTLVVKIDSVELERLLVDSIESNGMLEEMLPLALETPGRHTLHIILETTEESLDVNSGNNNREAFIRVEGLENPAPELSYHTAFEDFDLTIGERADMPLLIRNPGFAPTDLIPISMYIDDEEVLSGELEPIPPGGEFEIAIPWEVVTPGKHIVGLKLDLPDHYRDWEATRFVNWELIVPYNPPQFNTIIKDTWVPIGPSRLDNKSTGRMDRIIFHPTNKNIMYAAAPSGGLWKTTNFGGSWTPLFDGQQSLTVRGICLDPNEPDIVYASTFTTTGTYELNGSGIYKSLDGGKTWRRFASTGVATTIDEMFLFRSKTGIIIYAASDRGILRYKSNNPKALTSTDAEWEVIKAGTVMDIAFEPGKPEVMYTTMYRNATIGGRMTAVFDAVYRTDKASTARDNNTDWSKRTGGIDALSGLQAYAKIDIQKSNPKVMYMAFRFNNINWIFRSNNAGINWLRVATVRDPYFDYVRIHPNNADVIYVGGVKLFKLEVDEKKQTSKQYRITAPHDDQKILEFEPSDPNYYWALNDGGIWRCKCVPGKEDPCEQKNNNLQTMQFYDIDASRTKSMVVGGTQDNGTMVYYDNKAIWKDIKGGDGAMSVFNSNDNKVIYAQHQFLRDTRRCDLGLNCSPSIRGHWKNAANGLPGSGWGYDQWWISGHPVDKDQLFAQGTQLWHTSNGGSNWSQKGPYKMRTSEIVRRTAVQPGTNWWYVGTNMGRVYYSSNAGITWNILDTHVNNQSVKSMAFSHKNPSVLYVVYTSNNSTQDDQRVYQFTLTGTSPTSWNVANITANLPKRVRAPGRTATMDIRVICGDGHRGDVCYVGYEKGVYKYDDKTTRWTPYDTGLPNVKINDLVVDPTTLYLRAGTWGRGAWSVVTGP